MDNRQNYCPEILFVFPTFKEISLITFSIDYHLGVGYILAYLKNRGICAEQFIHREPIDLYALREKILAKKPKIIGFTCYDTNYHFVKLISQSLKKKNPNLIIMVGGSSATFSDELIMQDNPAIDICVRGEGEYTVYELIKQLKKNRDIGGIKGITYRQKGKVIQTPERDLIKGEEKGQELDILPSPYLKGIFPLGEQFGILASRGCIFKCIYCNFSAMSRWTIRYHSVERVVSELKIIDKNFHKQNKQSENRIISFWDDTFTLDKERARQICQRIIEEKIDLLFRIGTRADTVNKELLFLMHKAGVRFIDFGLESASPRVLNTIKKVRLQNAKVNNLRPEIKFIEKIEKNVKLAKKIGLEPGVSIIMGLPGSTIKDDRKTLKFVKRLGINHHRQNYLRIYAGTELFNTHSKYGFILKQSLTALPYKTKYPYRVDIQAGKKDSLPHIVTEKDSMEFVLRIFTGDSEHLQVNGYPDLLLIDYSMDNKTIEWLGSNIAISSGICFADGYFKNVRIYENINKILASNLPFVNFHTILSATKQIPKISNGSLRTAKFKLNVSRVIQTFVGISPQKLGALEFLPFTDSRQNILQKEKRRIVFTLLTFKDIENLIKLAAHFDKVVLEGSVTKFDCCFLDECRWSDKECPAVKFTRAIIHSDGLIFSCFKSKPIAKVGDSREGIVKNLDSMRQHIEEERDCHSCSVKDRCSKCLFTFPLNSNQYCKIRRDYPNVSRVLKLFKIVRQIRNFSRNIHFNPQSQRIVGAFDTDLVKIDYGRRSYLYNLLSQELYE